MATSNPNKQNPAVKEFYDFAQGAVDVDEILQRYNDLTREEFGQRRDRDRLAQSQFYNNLYDTQLTAMDAIRRSNAQAVQSGASRGMQAANQLAEILGLQSEAVGAATELANTNRETAREETAAMLQNILTANQEATQQRETLVTQGIEAESVASQERIERERTASQERLEQERLALEQERLDQEGQTALVAINETDPIAYANAYAQQTDDITTYSDSNYVSLQSALSKLDTSNGVVKGDFESWYSWIGGNKGNAAKQKLSTIAGQIDSLITIYGLDKEDYSRDLEKLKNSYYTKGLGTQQTAYSNFVKYYNRLKTNIASDYQSKSTQTPS